MIPLRPVVNNTARICVTVAATMLVPAAVDAFAGNPNWRAFALSAGLVGLGAGAIGSVKDTQRQGCESTNEFRRLFASYLEDQADAPGQAHDLAGYDDLDPPARLFVDSLFASLHADAARAQVTYDDYRLRFPIKRCD